jgi:putative tape measure domain protein|uniref:Tail tape measure protein n=1 Tax=Myoviridae sp. ctuJM17 TaxID=2825200 RepID=A0A8S5PJU0_9CAUD|nr:MAG TPA: tail tape measure protein [Myoviridae sp. ctuJM17]
MDNVLKFLIKLNADKGNVVSVARETERQLDSINRKASVVGRGLRKAFSFDGFKDALMSIPGMQFLMNPYTMIGAGVGAMVRLGAQAESVNVAFTTLVGSESKAAQMLGQINDFAAHSPFGKMDLTQSAQTMLNFGVETGKVLPLLRQLGDISGGDKDKMSALSLVMGQVSSTGYLMGQDLLQFINAGFNPIQELSQMTGISVDKLKDKMAKGQITYRNVEQAIAHATDAGGKFNGMMDKQSQTLSGKFSTLMDIVKQGAIDLSQSVNTPIAEVVEKITAAIPKVFAVFQAVFSAISAGIGFVVRFRTAFMILGGAVLAVWAVFRTYTMALAAYQAITTLVTAGTKIWTAAQWLLNVAMTANPIGLIVAGVAALIAVIVYCWTKFAGFRAFLITMWDVWRKFGELIKTYVVDRIKELIRGVGLLSKAFSKLFSGDFKGAAADFAAGVKNVSGVNSAVSLVKNTAATVRGIGGTFQKNLAAERAKDKKKEGKTSERSALSTPGLKGSAAVGDVAFGKGTDKAGKGKKGRRSAEEIATGGRRSTSITMHISKFFDTLHVHMADKADTAELERIVVQSMNRALAIATSTDRG